MVESKSGGMLHGEIDATTVSSGGASASVSALPNAAAHEIGFDGAERQLERFGNLRMCHAFLVVQVEHGPLTSR